HRARKSQPPRPSTGPWTFLPRHAGTGPAGCEWRAAARQEFSRSQMAWSGALALSERSTRWLRTVTVGRAHDKVKPIIKTRSNLRATTHHGLQLHKVITAYCDDACPRCRAQPGRKRRSQRALSAGVAAGDTCSLLIS